MRFGPIIKGELSVPLALAELLRQNGRPVPAPVRGFLLIDTGASSLCVAEAVTQELDLKPVGLRATSGVHGNQQNQVFHIRLTSHFNATRAENVIVQSEKSAIAIPGLDGHWDAAEMKTDDSKHPRRLIGLLGRDFLRHATLIYNGTTGVVEILLDLTTMPPMPT